MTTEQHKDRDGTSPCNAPRVFWLSHSPEDGGAERMMIEYCEMLATHFAITVGVPKGKQNRIWDRVPCNFAVVPIGYWLRRSRSTAKGFYGTFAKDGLLYFPLLVSAMRKAKPDVVVTNSAWTPGGALAARLLGIPHVWYVHESILNGHHRSGLFRNSAVARVVGSLSDRVVVNSLYLYDELLPTIGSKLRHVPPLVPIDHNDSRRPSPDEAKLKLVMVGAVSPEKRCEDGVRAVAAVANGGIDVDLSFVGPEQAEYRAHLDRVSADLNVEDRVNFLGPMPTASAALCNSHAVIVAAMNEGLGRVTIEAIRHGIPVIGARSGETDVLLTQSGGGLLFTAGDVGSLATAIARLASNRSMLTSMARSGRTWAAKHLDDEAATSAFKSILNEVRGMTWPVNGRAR